MMLITLLHAFQFLTLSKPDYFYQTQVSAQYKLGHIFP